MKRLSLSALIAAFAIIASQAAISGTPMTKIGHNGRQAVAKAKIEALKGTSARKISAKKSAIRRTPASNLPGPTEEQTMNIITEAPAGNTSYYTKHGTSWGYDYSWDSPYSTSADGYVAEIVTTDDSKIYIAPAFTLGLSQYGKTYFEGEIKDGVATFNFPQGIYRGTYSDNGVEYDDTDYIMLMEYFEDEDGYFDFVPCEKQTLSFKIAEDGTMTPVDDLEDTWLAAAWWGPYDYASDNDIWYWSGLAADWYTSLTPITEKPVEIPTEAKVEDWLLINGENAYEVGVAIDGENIYISGIMETMPNAAIAGKIADGKAVFPSVNYLGMNQADFYTVYAMSTTPGEINDPDQGMIDGLIPNGDPITFEFDSESNVLTGESIIGFSYVDDKCVDVTFELNCPVIQKPGNQEITSIADPEILIYLPYDIDYGYGAIMFSIPNLANEGEVVIPSNRLYFSIYINDEVYEFDPEDYPDFSEPMKIIPYKYTDQKYNTFLYDDEYMAEMIAFFASGFKTIGVQAIYKKGETEVYSSIVTIPGDQDYYGGEDDDDDDDNGDEDGIVSISADQSTNYFDMQGRKISAPRAGQIVIRKCGGKANVIKF